MRPTRRGFAAALLGAMALSVVATCADAANLQSWDNVIPNAAQRFKVLKDFNDEAVLDKETQLVWERFPDTATAHDWFAAQRHCYRRVVANRMGWRLPTIEEFTTLIDLSVPDPGAKLPLGHPFEVGTTNYWSSTTSPDSLDDAWFVRLANGSANTGMKTENVFVRAWCVRGGHGHDVP